MNVYSHNPYSNLDFSKVGLGYRNVCWIPGKRGKFGIPDTGHIVLFGYDKEGNRKTFKFPFCPSVKYEVKTRTPEIDLYGKYIDTKYFDDTVSRKDWISEIEKAGTKVITSYNPEQEFLLNHFRKYVIGKTQDDTFNQQELRVHYIDIEVAIEEEFPEPEFAKYPINLITVYDSLTKKFYSWALSTEISNTLTDMPIELRKFDNEQSLLNDYLEWHAANYPDVITGWNVRLFDMLYILNRLENVLGKDVAKKYSPIGRYRTNIEDKKNYNKKSCKISGISILDLLFLYRDKFGIKQALDGGYSLDNVASVEIEDTKLHYEGSMLDFYKSNFQKFWEYNVQDVNLVVKLEAKLKLLTIVRKITTFGCSPLESIYTTISYIISSLDIYARNETNKVFISHIPDDKRGKDVDKFAGAFVFPTQAGLYKQGLFTMDFNSLYPSTARMLNLSPETLVGVVKKNNEETSNTSSHRLTYVTGEEVFIDDDQLNAILDKACTIARNGALFYKHEIRRGIFADWCGNFFNMRKSYKKFLRECETRLKNDKCLTSEEIRKLEIDAEYYNATQYALKILINSAYGTLGTTYSPLYDVRLAEAITLTGRFANQSTSKFLNALYKEKYGAPDDMDITVSGDTDSVTGDMMLDVIFCKQ